jgi:hypothetical protein
VDALQREVAALAGAAALAREDPRRTFAAIARAAARAGGVGRSARLAAHAAATETAPIAARAKGRTPRLTEPWFC